MSQTNIKNDKLQFELENDKLLETLLDQRFFQFWKKRTNNDVTEDENRMWTSTYMELYFSANCNQHCEYCYLVEHHNELYPIDNDPELVLKNLNMVINWCIENDYSIYQVHCFSGEILHTKFGLDVLQTLLEGVKRGWRAHSLIWASNMSFIYDDEQTAKIQYYIDTFKKYDTTMLISASIDGLYCEDGRPFNDPNTKNKRDEAFYNKVFLFQRLNSFGFHPMVSAQNVKNWIKNFDWWVSMCQRYDYGVFDNHVMALEVRNANWTDEAIEDYNKLMDHMLDTYIEVFSNRVDWLADAIIQNHFDIYLDLELSGYIPWLLTNTMTSLGCTVPIALTIRLSDLHIVPCHRTSYKQFLYGYFTTDEEKITGIKAINPQMAMKILYSNLNISLHGCSNCLYKSYCMKGCFGSQYETTGDPFIPIENVCKFFKAKYSHLIKQYQKLGILDHYRKNILPSNTHYEEAQRLLKFYDEVIANDSLEKSRFILSEPCC